MSELNDQVLFSLRPLRLDRPFTKGFIRQNGWLYNDSKGVLQIKESHEPRMKDTFVTFETGPSRNGRAPVQTENDFILCEGNFSRTELVCPVFEVLRSASVSGDSI